MTVYQVHEMSDGAAFIGTLEELEKAERALADQLEPPQPDSNRSAGLEPAVLSDGTHGVAAFPLS